MSVSNGSVIAFPLKRKKKPEIRYRALPPDLIERQLQDINATIKGLLELRRALKAAYKHSLGMATHAFCMGFVGCQQWHAVVQLIWLSTCHKR